MINRTELISDLEALLSECFNTIANMTTYQQIKQNDARVTFFKHLVNVIDSTIISLLLSHKYMGTENWWKEIQKEYNLSARPIPFDREFDYYDQMVTNSFFLFVFISFESSIRLIVRRYDSNLYTSQWGFNLLSKGIISRLKLPEKDKFIDLITSIGNSIHNNGLYVPKNARKNVIPNKIEWNNIIFNFDQDKPIAIKDLWSGLIPISREVCIIFNSIINSDEIKKITFYDDPTESLI